MFENCKWIWLNNNDNEDEYVEFLSEFYTEESSASIRISADSDYVLYVNGKYISSNQYGDYEHYKIYDTISLDECLVKGKNVIAILGYHCGTPTSRYKPAKAGVIFEVFNKSGNVILISDKRVYARKSTTYVSGRKSLISGQLGYNFCYDARFEDNWINGSKINFESSIEVEKSCLFYPRPIKKHILDKKVCGRVIFNEDNKHFLIDLDCEYVGFPFLELNSKNSQKIKVAFGEHLRDGKVMAEHGIHQFSYEYFAKQGKNIFNEYMLRLGCRYLEVFADQSIDLISIGVIPHVYPIKERKINICGTEIDNKIYEICLRTLKLCMMEHYVDCPWREQALYAFDSRNQMLCGYYAFEDRNKEYAKANLKLISKDNRKDNLLSICFPCGEDLCIPSFSLYYIFAVEEYLCHTSDTEFVKSIYNKLVSIIDAFIINSDGGLIKRLGKKQYWDYYDWSDYMVGNLGGEEPSIPDAVINCLMVIALNKLKTISEKCNLEFKFDGVEEKLRLLIRENFYDKEFGALMVTKDGKEFCELTNALGILAQIFDQKESARATQLIVDEKLLPCSLSMKIFKYQALIKLDKEKYREYILNCIRKDYEKMLLKGATTVWETLDGADAFGGCGSLCHGWSAVPIYVYNLLNMIDYKD